ncbi:hypothetical protein DFH08DRAFT_871175 [Mycena albidolilacea]|uniref:Uncharacterized protein n=1 Tax=Mycena albidolilacea TaxID=1033008 RepID=A0AAD7EPW9_9AGAR|nr:hypothetical protein DFH08DRAFT_871175 [Mycena albidolilacea]
MSRAGGYTRLWRKFLPFMASVATNLTTVSLLEVACHSEPAAFAFLARLHLLTEFYLNLTYLLCDTSGGSGPLSSLLSIRASPSVVDHLLSRVGVGSVSESLRAIQSITLIWRPSLDTLLVLIRSIISVAS